ncbi:MULTISPECIES: LacI family DNA-binding transcriptional regulator [Microbacterium]|uniref:LacI family transcriptional regulator n=1 Tax=Microbacterium wangchenii TaxID=2541726 RepID=A0ABX5SXD3_9MICO|nr:MULTISPECIES: LacI family DNA-binding transcriptional regulator [Microbacterium]MCK6067256.1 LacI family transcriptional regulator [Microbacterium sp. EYE_512]QBR89797.1 LacI family transcriptional regulator [Microbacterium wangchenii]TXK16605.1 LacI family transcriptional regulator [Microbacterium wangchenii]
MPSDIEPPDERRASANVTIYEVAARSGVSIATVSHALNRPDRVAPTTRRRILETAEELGFVPRGRGRAVRTLRRIAVVAPFSTHSTYLQRLLGVLAEAEPDADVTVIDFPATDQPTIDRVVGRGPVDGLIIMGAEPTTRLAAELEDSGVPIVLLDRPSQEYTSVTVDDRRGGALVADHLLEEGVREIAWVSPVPRSSEYVTNGELRLQGFAQRLREAGFDRKLAFVVCDDSFEGGRAAAAELLAAEKRPDGVFALHDIIAAGVVSGLREGGVRVPDDVRVAGYDDVEVAEVFSVTTVRQPFPESGAAAVEALRALRANPRRPVSHISLLPELVVRGSTATTSPGAADQRGAGGGGGKPS